MKKFTESLQNSIFDDVDLLKNLLVDYNDIGLNYRIQYQLQKESDNNLYPVKISDTEDFNLQFTSGNKVNFYKADDYVKAYIIRFKEMSDILTSDYQRGDDRRGFFIPPDKIYRFFEITEDIQNKIESFGYTFTLSTRDSEFDIMILDGKYK
jgi:hypothetical protein